MKSKQQRAQKTRSKIMQTAFDLFHQKGIRATTVDEILEKSETGKSQFYYNFKSKDDLIHEVVQSFYKKLCQKELPLNCDVASWNDLEKWFAFFIDFQRSTHCVRGCPMATIGSELTPENELIRQDIHLVFEYMINNLQRFFSSLKAQGKLKESVDARSIAELCYMLMQGGMIVSKVKKETEYFEYSVKHLIIYLKSLEK